jgi:flavin reductase (DIM6/NTAB) family NADH-FMN oxidoreductase RutF
MANSTISIQDLRLKSFTIWEDQWFLLTCGDLEDQHFNSMTISWGSIGVMWNKPFVQVVVRPSRYTFEFMQKYPDFTVCAFPDSYHEALQLLGAESGRDGDKIQKAKITPSKALVVSSPAFVEANLILECHKMYTDVFRPQQFIDPGIEGAYNGKNYHTIYYGEILAISGDRSLYT